MSSQNEDCAGRHSTQDLEDYYSRTVIEVATNNDDVIGEGGQAPEGVLVAFWPQPQEPQQQSSALSFAEWVPSNGHQINTGLGEISTSVTQRLDLDLDNYYSYLIDRPELAGFEQLSLCIEEERAGYDFNPSNSLLGFQEFYGDLWERHSQPWNMNMRYVQRQYAQYLGESGIENVFQDFLRLQDDWAREERRLFSGLPRCHPEILHLDELEVRFTHLIDDSVRFGEHSQTRMVSLILLALDVIRGARRLWDPDSDQPILSPENSYIMQEIDRQAMAFHVDDLISEEERREDDIDSNEMVAEALGVNADRAPDPDCFLVGNSMVPFPLQSRFQELESYHRELEESPGEDSTETIESKFLEFFEDSSGDEDDMECQGRRWPARRPTRTRQAWA